MGQKDILFGRSVTTEEARPLLVDDDGTIRANVVAGGVGGGAMTVADGADVAQGTTTDAEAAAGNGTVIALLKRLRTLLAGPFYPPTQPTSTAEGQNQVLGLLADAAIVTDAGGTVGGKLRGLVKWTAERMPLVLGRLAMASSLPVVLATEQMPLDSVAFTPTSDPYMPIGGEFDDAAPAGLAEGQGGAARMSSRREWYVTIRDAAGNERGMNIDANGDVGVRSYGDSLSQTPTITAGAYIAGDAVGGLLTFANAARISGGGGVIKDALILDDAGEAVEMELWLFNATFTAMADNAAWAPSEADLRKLVAIISTSDGAWFAAGTPSAARIAVSQRYDLVGTSLFGQLVTRGAPTFAATDDVTVILGLLQD